MFLGDGSCQDRKHIFKPNVLYSSSQSNQSQVCQDCGQSDILLTPEQARNDPFARMVRFRRDLTIVRPINPSLAWLPLAKVS